MPVTYSGTSGTGAQAGVWRPIVTLNGSDVSAQVIGEIRIDAEEDAARIADLTLRPANGAAFTIAGWVGKSLTIDIADYATGSPVSTARLFAGLVDEPRLDLTARTVTLRATDNLQNLLDAMSDGAIDTAVPGAISSPAIFDPTAHGWARAQDRLSTLHHSLDLTTAAALRLTDWTPKTTADLAFTTSHILDGSLAVSLTSRSRLTNTVDISFGYRFPRVKAEGYDLAFNYVSEATIAQYVSDGGVFVQRAAVEQAIKSAGSSIESITYTPLPNVAAIGQWESGPYDIELCMGFSAVVSFNYGQMIEEQHTITVVDTPSVTAVGALHERLSGALEGKYQAISSAEHSITLFKNNISGVPPTNSASVTTGHTVATDVTLTTDSDRSAANVAMQALIATGKNHVWGSHRRNAVSASVALNPAIDVDQTISITTPQITAKGKCRSVSHRMSPDTGQATSDFQIAICSIAGTGVTHPDTPNTAPAGSSPATTTLAASPGIVFNGSAAGDHKITITFPAVASGERDMAIVPITASYNALLTEDPLTIAV
jgi:hypothetical protein